MRQYWRLFCVIAGFLLAGCGEEKLTVQDNLKGTWKLTSRTLPDGTTLKPPDVVGVMEWFAMDDRQGHVTVAVTGQRDGKKAHDFENDVCRLSATGISLERSLLMGQSYLHGDGPVETDTAPRSLSGGIATEGKQTTLKLSNGVVQAFSGSTLTVTTPSRYTDTWKKE